MAVIQVRRRHAAVCLQLPASTVGKRVLDKRVHPNTDFNVPRIPEDTAGHGMDTSEQAQYRTGETVFTRLPQLFPPRRRFKEYTESLCAGDFTPLRSETFLELLNIHR